MIEPAAPPRFRIGMTARVTAVVMLVASLVIVVNAVASRLAFQSRFLTYVNEQEAAILERMAEQIAEIYGRYGDWDALSEAFHRGGFFSGRRGFPAARCQETASMPLLMPPWHPSLRTTPWPLLRRAC